MASTHILYFFIHCSLDNHTHIPHTWTHLVWLKLYMTKQIHCVYCFSVSLETTLESTDVLATICGNSVVSAPALRPWPAETSSSSMGQLCSSHQVPIILFTNKDSGVRCWDGNLLVQTG